MCRAVQCSQSVSQCACQLIVSGELIDTFRDTDAAESLVSASQPLSILYQMSVSHCNPVAAAAAGAARLQLNDAL